jgi:hypothetical protein
VIESTHNNATAEHFPSYPVEFVFRYRYRYRYRNRTIADPARMARLMGRTTVRIMSDS